MVRRYGDPVEVRATGAFGTGDLEGPATPGSFLWRGRLYVVRAVLGHWQERRAWWAAAAARAVHGETDQDTSLPAEDRRSLLGAEQEVWRVEASPGRSFGVGVYDLCRDQDSAPAGAGTASWHLLRVAD